MVQTANVENGGKQVKVWLPMDVFDLLQARANHEHTSVGEQVRRQINAGLVPLGKVNDIHEAMIDLMRWFELHLEPLVFIAAMDSAFGAESWRYQLLSAAQGDVETMKENDRKLRERAKRRIQRKLNEVEGEGSPQRDEAEGEESDVNED